MKRVITVFNRKGGVGKTTTALILAAGLKKRGYDVLLVDLDPQASATKILELNMKKTMYQIAIGELTFLEAVQKAEEGFEVIAASNDLLHLEKAIEEQEEDYLIKQILKESSHQVIIIDCPPALGSLTNNALIAANLAIAPIMASRQSIDGLSDLIDMIKVIKERFNPTLDYRILITMFDGRRSVGKGYKKAFKESLGDYLFKTYINTNADIEKAQEGPTSVLTAFPRSNGARQYKNLVREVINID